MTIDGTVITGNSAREGGGAVFFVSNDRTGTLRIEHSRLRGNPNAGFQTAGYPGVFFLGRGTPLLIASTLRLSSGPARSGTPRSCTSGSWPRSM